MTVAAGTDLQGDDASILYWYVRLHPSPRVDHSDFAWSGILGIPQRLFVYIRRLILMI